MISLNNLSQSSNPRNNFSNNNSRIQSTTTTSETPPKQTLRRRSLSTKPHLHQTTCTTRKKRPLNTQTDPKPSQLGTSELPTTQSQMNTTFQSHEIKNQISLFSSEKCQKLKTFQRIPFSSEKNTAIFHSLLQLFNFHINSYCCCNLLTSPVDCHHTFILCHQSSMSFNIEDYPTWTEPP